MHPFFDTELKLCEVCNQVTRHTKICAHEDIPTSWDCTWCKRNGSQRAYTEVDDVIIFTKLLDGAYIFQCICGHIHRGNYGEHCNSCGRIHSQENTKPCSSEEYRASRAN